MKSAIRRRVHMLKKLRLSVFLLLKKITEHVGYVNTINTHINMYPKTKNMHLLLKSINKGHIFWSLLDMYSH